MVAFEHDSTEKPIKSDIDGSENIQERHSDLYSTHNVSRRVPRISTFIEKGATNSKRFETDFSMSVWEPYIKTENSFVTNDFGGIIKRRGRQRSQFEKSDIKIKNYFTEWNKENFEPQTTYQTLNNSLNSINFGPKALTKVLFLLTPRNRIKRNLCISLRAFKKSRNPPKIHSAYPTCTLPPMNKQ